MVGGVGGAGASGFGGAYGLSGGGGVDTWALRGDKSARDKAHRRARAEMKRFTASKKFPLDVGVVQVHSLGKVRMISSSGAITDSTTSSASTIRIV